MEAREAEREPSPAVDVRVPPMRPQPLISVTDLPQSSRWYQELLRCESGHGGDEYERLLRDGTLVLPLHRFDVEHHHGRIGDPTSRAYGNGVALWFEIELWLRDPDGYLVVLASPDGESPWPDPGVG